jgi:putative addiction module component (TIGR02574 family)
MTNLQTEIGSLSTAEKFELLDVLWQSLEADTPALTDEQRSELDSRVALYKQNPLDVVPWEEVRAGLRKRH